MNSFRARLTLIMIVLIGLSVLAAGLFMGKTFKDNHIDALQDNMVREMSIILDRMDWRDGSADQLYGYYTDEARRLKDITGSRITFIRGDGQVLGDSDHEPQTMDNHAQRIEVREAKKSGIGRAIRRSDTLGENLLYVAMTVRPGDPGSDIIRLAISLQEIDRSIRRIWTTLLLGLLVLFAAAALISFRVASGLTRPLEQITRVAKRIKNLDYKARVSVKGSDEIGELGLAINAMADGLQVQMERIHQNESQLASVLDNMLDGVVMIDTEGHIVLMNRCAEEILGISAAAYAGRHYGEAKQQYELSQIIQDGLARREHLHEEITLYFPEERLLELNLVPIFQDEEFGGVLLVLQDVSAIRRLERMRSEFVANVSHELKTPVTAVKGFAETLLGGAVDDPDTARSFLQIIFDESDRLNRLIGDILELSKIESRRVPLQFSPVELEPFIGKTIELMSAEAARKHIRITMEAEPGLFVEADEDRLRQIIMNLLANGISYTPEGGSVSIKAGPTVAPGAAAGEGDGESEYDYIRITIADSGIGIPKKDLPRIFERFYRVDKARSRSSGGTGLGLSIVKHLVELHKGTIAVDSQLGVGSTFTIDLPVLQ